jgi:hypothetical protein
MIFSIVKAVMMIAVTMGFVIFEIVWSPNE